MCAAVSEFIGGTRVNEVIRRELTKIEKQQSVRVLYACEAGSRAYGMDTKESDYDVRIITIKPVRSYLTVSEWQETWSDSTPPIEWHSWDIFKALRLFQKSNPSLYEWFSSPIIYAKDDYFYTKMKEMIQQYYSLRSLAYHYYSLTVKNANLLLKKEIGSKAYIKTYVQALRGGLALHWIVRHHALPPLSLFQLADGDESIMELICLLRQAKVEKRMDFPLTLPAKVLSVIHMERSVFERLPDNEAIDVRLLDEFVWALLEV
jgi:predicted nucleotidyltransferase